MSYAPSNLAACAIAFSLLANSATADLTPAQVWGDWRAYLEGMGYTVTATEADGGDTLTVADISVQIAGGPDIEDMTVSLGGMQFVQAADGAVEVVMPETMPIVIDVAPKSTQRPAQISFDYSQTGQKIIASGDPSAIVFDYSADTFGLALATLNVDGTTLEADNARFKVGGEALQSQTKVTVGDTRTYDQSMQMGQLTYDVFFQNPQQVEALNLNSVLKNLTFAGTSVLPIGDIAQAQGLAPLLAAGFAFDGTMTTGTTETQTEITSAEGTSKIKTGSQGSTFTVAMGQDGLRYDVAAQDVQMGAQVAGLPFPLFAQMAQAGMALNTPVQKSDTPQDFAISFNMTDFSMSDIIWALFDPSSQLPRDPATIAVDLTGKAKVLFDAFDPASVEALAASGSVPGEIHALTLNSLVVDAVGAKIDANGDLTFDNSDRTTLPGFPKPVGDFNINVAGANGLMDKLVAMGLLPSEQVMGARLMLGLFAVPGAAPDTLTSKIEFNEAGQILANGQRVK